MFKSFALNLDLVAPGIKIGDKLDLVEPIVGELVVFVDQGQIEAVLVRDGAGGDADSTAGGEHHHHGTCQKQCDFLFHTLRYTPYEDRFSAINSVMLILYHRFVILSISKMVVGWRK